MTALKLKAIENIKPGDGVMLFVLREDGSKEVHFPQLGRLTEGQLEQSQLLMYRELMQARAREYHGDSGLERA